MQTLLLVAVVACSAIGFYVAHYHYGFYGTESDRESLFKSCTNKTGIASEEAKTLRDTSADATLSSGQQSFICCMADHLISNGTLNTTGVQIMVDENKWGGPDFNLSTVISSCESNEINANNLDSCRKIAPFMHCVYSRVHPKSNKTESSSTEPSSTESILTESISTESEAVTSELPQTESMQTELTQTESFQTESPDSEIPVVVEQESKGHHFKLFSCVKEAGIHPEDAKALSDTPANATLTSEQESFICCMSRGLISNGKLNATSVQNMIDRRGWNDDSIDLSRVISSCESDDVNANNLVVCEKIAPFVHCIHNKVPKKPIKPEVSEQIDDTESKNII